MADIALAASPIATPLAVWLASSDNPHHPAVYRGVMTPRELDVPTSEIEALASSAAVHDLGWLRRIRVRGADRFRWLSGMVTNDVNGLPPNTGAWNLVLNSQGRIQGDLTVWRDGDNLKLNIAVDQLDRLLTHLDRFIIMDDVELGVREGETALGLTGPKAGEVLSRLGLKAPPGIMTHTSVEFNGMSLRIRRSYGALAEHYEIWSPIPTVHKLWKFLLTGGATAVGSAAVEAFRVAEGIPLYGVDIVERDLPQETYPATAQPRAIHFSKGCYLGQEIVERIRSRGNVHRHLRQLELDGPLPAPGAELALNGAPAGHITSAAELPLRSGTRRFALAMLRAEAELANQPMSYTSGEATGTARLLPGPTSL